MKNENVFRRSISSPWSSRAMSNDSLYASVNSELSAFSGADLSLFINNVLVGHAEAITWTISTEAMPSYVMGQQNPKTILVGKRIIQGSLLLAQYHQHALIKAVFDLDEDMTISDLWDTDTPALAVINNDWTNIVANDTDISLASVAGPTSTEYPPGYDLSATNYISALRGLTRSEMAQRLREQMRVAAKLKGATKIQYVDQLPLFDITLVGVHKNGTIMRCSIFGVQITQETMSFSINDMSQSVGFAWTALGVSPIRAITNGGDSRYTTNV